MQYYSIEDVAKRLQVSYRTIYRWFKQGYFPNALQAERGGKVRIPEKDILNPKFKKGA